MIVTNMYLKYRNDACLWVPSGIFIIVKYIISAHCQPHRGFYNKQYQLVKYFGPFGKISSFGQIFSTILWSNQHRLVKLVPLGEKSSIDCGRGNKSS